MRTILLAIFATLLAAAPPPSRHYFQPSGSLTGPDDSSAQDIALNYLMSIAPQYGLSAQDLRSIYVAKEYQTGHNGVSHVIFAQRYHGIDVAYSEFVVNIDAQGRIINAGGNLFPAPPAGVSPAAPESLSPSIRAAMRRADPASNSSYTPIEIPGNGKLRRFHRASAAGDIHARSIWYPEGDRLAPAWQFYLNDSTGVRHAATIDSRSHETLETRELTLYQEPPPPRGRVFTGTSPQPNPRPGFLMTEPPPVVPRVLVSFAGDPQASPAGWVEGTETEGNNAIAGKNPLGELFLVEPVKAKSPTRDFQFPLESGPGAPSPTNYIDAAITNLFYWMNRSHDLFWHIGFDEAAGNYQKRNFGRGGIDGDPIYAYAHFGVQQVQGATFSNAFYTTQGLEDGSPAMIGMFLGAGSNATITDGSLDSEVMVHEYTHGVSLRLVRNLAGHHGGAMGEAWSDFYALEFTTPQGAPPHGQYSTADYFLQRLNVGIRTRPYSTDMAVNPITFADLGRVSFLPAIHSDAGIWVQALLEMRANLIAQFGEPEGRRRVRLLVLDGMKLSVPSPSMVDARDAILLADRTNFRGESQSQIWQAFAKRGLGATAYSPSNNSTHVSASFAVSSDTGALAFTEPSYTFGESVRVILHDANLTGDVALVQLTSREAGSDVQTIRLRRSGSIFTGVVPTSSFAPALVEDGGLAVLPGSVISVYYNDASTDGGTPRQISASVPFLPGYARTQRAPSFQFANETPLNLRSGPGAIAVSDLPWEFPFFGRTYSSVRVLSNGLLAFDLPPSGACSDANLLRQITGIAPLFGQIRTNGTTQPNQNVFVGRPSDDAVTFRWAGETNVQPGFGVIPEPVNFAVTLYQDGRIEFHYGSGNRSLVFPSPTTATCAAGPVVGISSGNGAATSLATEYIGRTNLENAPSILFEPPHGFTSAPEVHIAVPSSTDEYQGILTGEAVISDADHRVVDVYIIIDGVLRGRANANASRAQVCQAQRLPNCAVFSFNYNFADLDLPPGAHTLTVRAMNARGGIGESQVTFNVTEGQSRTPAVQIDIPDNGQEISGTLLFRGYAAAPNLRIVGIDILIDGITYGRAVYGQPRADVCSSLGFTSPNCPGIGWTFNLNTSSGPVPLPDGEHLLQVRIQDETGRFTTYPETPVAFRVANGPNASPMGVLATPVNGQRVSGTVLIWGYAWDADGKIQTVQLLVDGVVRGTLPYGDTRPGECASLPEVGACPNIGFWHDFNTKTLLNGPHVLGIRVVDDRGRAAIIPQNAAGGMTIIVEN